MSKISTESYKGVRDFYPEDMYVQNYIFGIWRDVVESYGYIQYDASILESAELYRAKSGEEIVNEQTYTFIDRGEREVTLRPEMTPTVARMVAAKYRDLTFPLRWYSIPNLFRYEKPQRGRLREHWQLNVDLFGPTGVSADTEIIAVAYAIMKKIGAQDTDFIIRLNNRKLINVLYNRFNLNEDQSYKVSKIIDKKDKISAEAFADALREIIGDRSGEFIDLISSNEKILGTLGEDNEIVKELIDLIESLENVGIKNVVFDPTLMRGFDYYTSTVFEIFDTNPVNARALAGGGRYDDLLDIFGAPKVPTIGFGWGDVTMADFLETHNLLPSYQSPARVYICVVSPEYQSNASAIAGALRAEDVNTVLDLSGKKLGDQIKIADKQKIAHIIVVGEDEVKTDTYSLKELSSGKEQRGSIADIVNILNK